MDYYNGYEYSYGQTDSIVTGILAIYLIALVVMFIFYVVSYIFKAVGMYTMAKRQGMDYPWLAFIPFARAYLQGELAGTIQLKSRKIKNPGIWLLALPFIGGAVSFIFYILFWMVGFATVFAGGFFSSSKGSTAGVGTAAVMGILIIGMIWCAAMVAYGAIYKVFGVLVNYQILERFTTRNMSIAHAVLCKFIPLYESICFFVMRNKDFQPGMEPAEPHMDDMYGMDGTVGVYVGRDPQMIQGETAVEEIQVETQEETPVVIVPPAPEVEVEEAAAEETQEETQEETPVVIVPPTPEVEVEEAAAEEIQEETPVVIVPPTPELEEEKPSINE